MFVFHLSLPVLNAVTADMQVKKDHLIVPFQFP